MKNQAHPIVVVKRQAQTARRRGARFLKIAYADFMTAMMAFFLVMWLISISSPKELIQIAEYFRTPLATAVTGEIGLPIARARYQAAAMITPNSRVKWKSSRISTS